VLLMDLGVQANHVSNQAWIFGLRADAHSRVNTVYMVTYFVGGALGALASSAAYGAWGWGGSCAVGTAMAGAALVRLLWAGRRARRAGGTAGHAPDARLVSG
jgi:predicted MFS family arabinose efflux permease